MTLSGEPSLRALEEEAWEEWDGSGSFAHHCIAGSAAGVAEHVLMFPIDTYKVSAAAPRKKVEKIAGSINRAPREPFKP
jgi:hypothetical protein